MPKSQLFAAALLVCASTPATAEPRQLGAHQHGQGTLNLAVEGNIVSLELEAPGADIAGFEHEAKTAGDKAKLEKAIATLKEPLKLFKLPEAAQCSVRKAEAKLEHEHPEDGKSHDHSGEKEAEHADFHAEYELDCKSPANLTSVTLGYFTAFKSAQGLTVGVITPKGQSKFEATRDKPAIDLSGLN